jgi:hypothetical protein
MLFADRVQESVSNQPDASTAFNLAGAVAGHQGFVAGIGDGNTCIYCAQAVDVTGAPSGEWEVGIGTITDGSPDTLSRDYLIGSSSGSFIDWSAAAPAGIRTFIGQPSAFFNSRSGNGPGVGTTRWHGPNTAANPTATTTFAAFQIRAVLIPWVVGVPIAEIGIEVLSIVAGGNCRLGVYEDFEGLPGRLLGDSGDIAQTIAIKTHTFATPLISHTPWVWCVYVSSVSDTGVRSRIAPNNIYGRLLGWPDAGSPTTLGGLYVTDANVFINGLPDPFGTPTFAGDTTLPEVRIKG